MGDLINDMLNNNDFLILYRIDGNKNFIFCKDAKSAEDFTLNLNSFKGKIAWHVLETAKFRLV